MSVVWTAVSVQGDVIWDFASGAVLLISVLFLPRGFPGGSDGKEPACNARDPGLIPGSGRFPGEGSDYPIQYSCSENPIVGDSSWNLKELVMTKRIALSFSFLPVEFPRVMLWPSHKLWESHNIFCFFFFLWLLSLSQLTYSMPCGEYHMAKNWGFWPIAVWLMSELGNGPSRSSQAFRQLLLWLISWFQSHERLCQNHITKLLSSWPTETGIINACYFKT